MYIYSVLRCLVYDALAVFFSFLFYIFHICATECTLTRVHISVFVCVWVAVGEQGGAKDPDVVASALLQHMAMGAKGSRHDRESLGT